MGNGGVGVGLLTVTVGGWLLYCAVTNQGPAATAKAIVKTPTKAGAILSGRQYQFQDMTSLTAGATTASGQAAVNATGGGGVVSFARAQIGKPYIFGGTGNPGWDCSGLTQAALKNAYGISVLHSATAQLLDPRGVKVAKADLQQGDLVFPDLPPLAGDHVQIYSGNGNIIEAPMPGKKVREVPMWGFYTARRYGVGSLVRTN